MMYSFRVLGSVDLRGPDDRRIGSLLSQPKRLSLLALLTIEAPRRLQRDEVVGLLWPEMSDERARGALRQALHYLRRSLGPGVITGKGEEGIGVAPDKLECDAAELLRAAAEGRFGDALDLHSGELLPGFHLDGAPMEFERWLAEARRRVRRATARAAREVAAEEESRGNAVAAGAAARKAWELGDQGEPALQALLELLVRTGDASGARDAYEAFTERLRREHGTGPSAATREILDPLERPLERPFGGPVERAAGVEKAPVVEVPDAIGVDGPTWGATARRAVAWAGAGALLLGFAMAGWALLSAPGDGLLEGKVAGDGQPSLYLEPVRDLRGEAGPWEGMAEAITTELAGRLSETAGFRVVALAAGEEPQPGPGVRLRSTLREATSGLQLSVLLLDPASDAVLDRLTTSLEGQARSAPEVLAGRMAPRIRQGAGDVLSLRGLADRGIDADALRAVREATTELEAGDGLRVRGAVEAAALAYTASDSLLRRAAVIERGWAEPTLRRAEVSLNAMWLHLIPPRRTLELAHREVLRGLAHADAGVAMAPEDARAREVRGVLRYWAAQTTDERARKASFRAGSERDLEEAVGRDPGLPRAWSILSALSEKRGDFAAAYHRARRAYITDYDLRAPSDILARLYTNALEAGDVVGAAEWCGEIRRQEPDDWLGPYCDLTHRAWVGPWVVAESDSLLEEGLRLLSGRGAGGELARRFELVHAVVLARAGEAEAARAVLASAGADAPETLDVLDLQAWVRTALGEPGRARDLLAAAAALNPEAAPRVLRSRRYSDLTAYAVVRNDE